MSKFFHHILMPAKLCPSITVSFQGSYQIFPISLLLQGDQDTIQGSFLVAYLGGVKCNLPPPPAGGVFSANNCNDTITSRIGQVNDRRFARGGGASPQDHPCSQKPGRLGRSSQEEGWHKNVENKNKHGHFLLPSSTKTTPFIPALHCLVLKQ